MAIDPFNPVTESTLNSIVRWLQRSYILGLVSFFPDDVQDKITQYQDRVAALLADTEDCQTEEARKYLELHPGNGFHFTQLLLRFDRNASRSPIRASELAKPGINLAEALRVIKEAVSETEPFRVLLDKSFIVGMLFALVGYCDGEVSIMNRHRLLKGLSEALPKVCNVEPRILNVTDRGRQSNPQEFQEVHCTVGVIKRKPPLEYATFAHLIEEMRFEPIEFTVESISLVHTKFLSYAPPQKGIVTFELSKLSTIDEKEMLSSMCFAQMQDEIRRKRAAST